jgi:hypothetical protein
MRALVLVALTIGCGSAQPVQSEPVQSEPVQSEPVQSETTSSTAACVDGTPPPGSAAARLDWMIGAWSSTGEDGADTIERWCLGRDGALVGENRTNAGGRVVHSETLRIEARGESLVYVASPIGQATTEFTGSAQCGGDRGNCAETCEAVFSNPAHDFPSEIIYGRCLQNELLVATIRGGERRASWTFERQQ